ncbi:MAG: hypothetical protein KKH98_06250 [Spirochaetes bacterium]|nr:hypothetical protein [Spirochaetota bacterium]
MIKDHIHLQKFEKKLIRNAKLSYKQKLRIMEAMWAEGKALGVIPLSDPLEGIEVDIRIAEVLNSCSKN